MEHHWGLRMGKLRGLLKVLDCWLVSQKVQNLDRNWHWGSHLEKNLGHQMGLPKELLKEPLMELQKELPKELQKVTHLGHQRDLLKGTHWG